jgi:hypothetical protein
MGEMLTSFIRKFWPQALAGALMAAPTYFNFTHAIAGLIFFFFGAIGLAGLFYEIYKEFRPKSEERKHPAVGKIGIFSGAIVLILISWYFWPSVSDVKEDNIFFNCHFTVLPDAYPTTGLLNLLNIPIESLKTNGTLYISEQEGVPGSSIKWPGTGFALSAYYCELTNDTGITLLNVNIKLDIESEATAVAKAIFNLHLVRFDAGASNKYIFYIRNRSADPIWVRFAKDAKAVKLGEKER